MAASHFHTVVIFVLSANTAGTSKLLSYPLPIRFQPAARFKLPVPPAKVVVVVELTVVLVVVVGAAVVVVVGAAVEVVVVLVVVVGAAVVVVVGAAVEVVVVLVVVVVVVDRAGVEIDIAELGLEQLLTASHADKLNR